MNNPIEEFTKRIIAEPLGFRSYEQCELPVFNDRDIAIADWTIRCLANPQCEGSDLILALIESRREEWVDPISRLGNIIRKSHNPLPPEQNEATK